MLVDQGLREEVWTVSRLGLCHRRFWCGRETVVDVVGLALVDVSVSRDLFLAFFFIDRLISPRTNKSNVKLMYNIIFFTYITILERSCYTCYKILVWF